MTAPADSLPITSPPTPDAPLPQWLADVLAAIVLRQVDADAEQEAAA